MVFMTFGKHRGRAVADLPKGYLRWLLAECDQIEPWLARVVRQELSRRGERYVEAEVVLSDLEETLTAAVAGNPAIDFDVAGVVADHVLTTFEAVRAKYGITADTELVVPPRRVAADVGRMAS